MIVYSHACTLQITMLLKMENNDQSRAILGMLRGEDGDE